MDKSKNFEREIPENYVLVKHINTKNNKKIVTIYSILSLVPLLVILPVLIFAASFCSDFNYNSIDSIEILTMYYALIVFMALYLFYMVLHEITHGITYKVMTGGKLKFGLTLTVAFCGVPDIYVRKRASIMALIMPFAVFSVVLAVLTVGMYFVSPYYGIIAGALFAAHLGGCVGDLHWTLMYLTKFKHCNTIMRDNGPEQWLYIPRSEAEEYGITIEREIQ